MKVVVIADLHLPIRPLTKNDIKTAMGINYIHFIREGYKNMKEVKSSTIAAIDYESQLKLLTVQFKRGGTYVYYDVPQEVYEGLDKAESIGKYHNQFVKTAFKFTKIKD